MDFLVMKMPVPGALRAAIDGGSVIPMSDRPKSVFASEQAACAAAQGLAETNPGDVYIVLKPLVAFEAKKPEKIDVVVKEYNSSGELVVMKE